MPKKISKKSSRARKAVATSRFYKEALELSKKRISGRVKRAVKRAATVVQPEIVKVHMLMALKDNLLGKLQFELEQLFRQRVHYQPSSAEYIHLAGEIAAMKCAIAIVTVEILEHWENYAEDRESLRISLAQVAEKACINPID